MISNYLLKTISLFYWPLLFSITLLNGAAAYAEDIILPIASQGGYLGNLKRPSTGEKQQQVLEIYGEPMKRYPPNGSPAIIRWDYQDFSVYFENNTVIHSVLKHRRQDKSIKTK